MTFHFNSFTNSLSGDNSALVFFTIFDVATNAYVYSSGFAPATTAVTILGNTLSVGHQFQYEIDFSNRLTAPTANTQFPGFIGYDSRTLGSFQTAAAPVPEPGTLASAGLALFGLTAWSRRRRSPRCRSC